MKKAKSQGHVAWTLLRWALGTPVLAYAVLVGINFVDEVPSDDFTALTAPTATNANPVNGYLAYVGMMAPATQDPLRYGAQWVSSFEEATSATAIARTQVEFGIDTLQFAGDTEQLCNPSKAACLALAYKRAAGWQQLAADNVLLLQRQRQMVASASFEEAYSPPSMESPLPTPDLNRSKLLELDLIAVDAAQGRLAEALTALAQRLAFDRRALQGSRSLLMGMVATSWLEQDYALLTEIVASYPAQLAGHQALLVQMATPLEVEALRRTAMEMFKGEYRLTLTTFPREYSGLTMGDVINLDEKEREGSIAKRVKAQLMRPLYKHQASGNLVAGGHKIWLDQLQTFQPENAQAWFSDTAQRQRVAMRGKTQTWRIIYNPVGKVILRRESASSSQDRYLERLFALRAASHKAGLQVACALGTAADADRAACQNH